MPDLLPLPMHDRAAPLRELWARLGRQAGARPIALYGAGRHTRALLQFVLAQPDGPRVRFIIDDHPGATREIRGIPVRPPDQARPGDVALVLVSSDSLEDLLAQRAQEWVGAAGPPVVRIYADAGGRTPRQGAERYREVWGWALEERQGHLPISPTSLVRRLPRLPDRAAGDPLPLPPPELRAGYHAGDDAAYLASGQRDVAAMRDLIRRHAPEAPPIRRVLDWGCSAGRMIRHWVDVADQGGEVWGCDICATALNWAAESLSPPLRFFQATTHPSLPLPDAALDLVYANSVLTHIRDLVEAWLMELRRLVRPGGLVLATILDENSWDFCSTHPDSPLRRRCPQLDFALPLEDDCVSYEQGLHNVTFWHSRGVRRRWSFAFDVLAIEHGTVPYQSGVLLRRR